MTQQEQVNLINTLIIDNNIMAVTPAIAREVLIAMVMSQTPSPSGSFNALPPLEYYPFANQIAFLPIANGERRVIGKGVGNPPAMLQQNGDIVQGWSPDGKSWWDSAVYNGGDTEDESNYTIIVGNQIIP